MGRHLATFSFSHRFFTEIYQPGRLEFQKKGLTAFWLGDVLFSLEYKDLLHVEITGRFPPLGQNRRNGFVSLCTGGILQGPVPRSRGPGHPDQESPAVSGLRGPGTAVAAPDP